MRGTAERACRSRPRGPSLALVLAYGVALAAGAPRADDKLNLERDTARLKQQFELVSQKKPYLVLDLKGQRLRLMSEGAVLRDYPILQADVGTPKVAFVGSGSADDWRSAVRRGAKIDPERKIGRIEMVPSGVPGDPVDIPVPAVPEEAIPAPERYVLRYDDGFTIEIRAAGSGAGGFWSRTAARLDDALEVVRGARAPRVRLVLSAEHAGALYRSFPVESSLLIL